MPSLKYLLTGKPRTFRDCLARSTVQLPKVVTAVFKETELLCEAGVVHRFTAELHWWFPEISETCTTVLLGGTVNCEDEHRRARRRVRALERFMALLAAVQSHGVKVAVLPEEHGCS